MLMSGPAKDFNVLFIISDQHKQSVAGCYGDPVIQTPHLDRLAAAGVCFDRAYCHSPLCAPSRGSILSGQHCHTCGSLNQQTPLRSHVTTLADVFRTAGYHTGSIGKVHVVGESQERDLGFTHREFHLPKFDEYAVEDYARAVGEAKVATYNAGREEFVGVESGEWSQSWYNPWNKPTDLKEEEIFDSMVVDRAERFLEQNRQERFFLWVGLDKPHPMSYAPAKYHQLYDPAKMLLPPDFAHVLQNVPASMRRRQEYLGVNQWPASDVRSAIAAYYAMVSYMDACVGRLVASLERLGLAERTLIVYTSDHGDTLFENGWIQKHCFLESAVRVPLLLWNPQLLPAGKRVADICSLTDLYPSLCDLCDLEQPGGLEGHSLVPSLNGQSRSANQAAFSEYYWTSPPSRMIRTPEWKYIYTHGEIPQLYDVAKDPGEKTNLAADAAYRAIGAALEKRVLENWDPEQFKIDLTVMEKRYRQKEVWLENQANSRQQ